MHLFFDEMRYFVNYQVNMRPQNELGKKGEDLATDWLKRNGYGIRERNYRFGRAEIDILARKGGTLAVVEVKMRRIGQLKPLHLAVDQKKRERIIKAADHYVLQNELDVEVRFDVIHIVHQNRRYTIEHLEAAFSPF